MEPDFLTLLIIAAPGALVSVLCFVLAAVFMDRARGPAMLVMLAGLLTAMQAGFTIINHLLLLPMMIDGALSNDLYSVLVNGVYHLLYVAITRAKKELHMSYTKSRFIFGDYQQSIPSRFIAELPDSIKVKEMAFEDSFGGGSSFSGYQGSANNNSSSYGGSKGSNSSTGSNYYKKPGSGGSYGKGAFISQKSTGYNPSSGLVVKASRPKPAPSGDLDPFFEKRVFHQKFGYGKVANINGDKLEIEFEKTGKKTIMKNFVKIA